MNKILVLIQFVFCLQFGLHADNNSNPVRPELFQVAHGKAISIYYYNSGKDNYTCQYENLGKASILLTITKNGKKQMSFRRDGDKAPSWATGASNKFEAFTNNSYNGLKEDIQIILGVQKNHVKAQPMMWDLPEPGSSNMNQNPPRLWIAGWTLDPGQAVGSNCFYSKDCSCGKESIRLTCPCYTIGLCKLMSINVCDRDQVTAEPINCRMVTSCMGYCE